MGFTTSGTLPEGIQEYFEKTFLSSAQLHLVNYQVAQMGEVTPLASGEGGTVRWLRYLPLPKRTTPLDETVNVGITSAKEFKDMKVQAEIDLYGDYAHIGHKISIIYIDPGISKKTEIIGAQMGESIDDVVKDVIHGGDYSTNRIRVDDDAAYTHQGTGGSGGSALNYRNAALDEADDYWNDAYLICIDRFSKAYGEVRLVDDFVAVDDEVQVLTAFSETTVGFKYRLVASDGIAASDKFTTSGIRLSRRELKRKHALKFKDGSWVCILPVDAEYDFLADTTWVDVGKYQDAMRLKGAEPLEGERGQWFGIRFVIPSVECDWREAAGTMGTYSEEGAVYVTPFFGREAMGVVNLAAQPQNVYVMSWRDLGQEIPKYSSVGWEVGFVAKVLTGVWAVGLMHGATV